MERRKDTIRYRLRRAFVNPFSIVLLCLAVISLFTDVIFAEPDSRNYTSVIIILCMLLVSGIVRFVQEMRTKRITDSLLGLVDTTVQVFRDGSWREVDAGELKVGDRVRVEAGDRVPADIRLSGAEDLFVSQSVITGESGIVEKTAEPVSREDIAPSERGDTLLLGSTVIGGCGEGEVFAVGPDTVYGAIAPAEPDRKRGYDLGETSIAWVLIRFMVVLVPIVFVACGLTKGNWLEAVIFALSVAVGLTPELLPMVISACLARGSYLMGKKQTVVKSINAMQGFGSMDILCTDKTGTLTGDQVQLEYYTDVFGDMSRHTLDCAYLNSYYHTGVANHLDSAILMAAGMPEEGDRLRETASRYRKLDEMPFDYARMFAGVLLERDDERIVLVKGSVDYVLERCRFFYHRGERLEIQPEDRESVGAVAQDMLRDGMKVLAVAGRRIESDVLREDEEREMTLLGYVSFFDAPKRDAAGAIEKLKDLHIGVKVLTGDHADVAVSVCRRIGIETSRVITGVEFDALSRNDRPIAIERCSVFAELTPKQKEQIVDILQENGHTVGFLGDGMNDLPAVAHADVGISVDTATDAVKDGADVILLKKDLDVLSDGVVEGRKAFANMSKYIKITASSNFGNICAVVIASVLLPFLPMASIQLLLLNLLYDILCLVLPWDNVDGELIENPMEWSGRRLGRFMVYFGLISTVFDVVTFVFLYFFLCPMVCGGDFHALGAQGQALFISLFQTGWFLESMWTQVLILHLLRTKQLPFVQSRPSRSMVLVTIFGIALFTILTVTPPGGWFGMTMLPAGYYAFLVVVVILYLLSVTLMKRWYIKRHQELI